MKIVAIMGSPKGKGDGYKIVKEIERQMRSMGEVEFEYVFLKDARVDMCKGCWNCAYHGEDKCPLRDDDLASIRGRMLEADGLILSSPVYARSICGLMKNFVDRLSYNIGRPAFYRQKALLVLNSGSGVTGMGTFTEMGWAINGARIVHKLHVSTPWYPRGEKMVRKREKAIRIASEKLFKACLDKKLSKPSFLEYLLFRLNKAFNLRMSVFMPAGYEFYRDKEYYYETEIGPIAKLSAAILLPIFLLIVKDLLPASEREIHQSPGSDT